MRAFFSHSSHDKQFVTAVYEALATDAVWIDKVEIDGGDIILDKIEQGLIAATDFVLFWSEHAAKSEWVRLECNMIFIRLLREKAVTLRLVLLDDTPLPLRFQIVHHYTMIGPNRSVQTLVDRLTRDLALPQAGVRTRFLNRSQDLQKVERAIDDDHSKLILLTGLQGVGKRSIAKESLRRFYEGADSAIVNTSRGTGLVELALMFASASGGPPLPVGLSEDELLHVIGLALDKIASDRRFLLITDSHHLLDEDGSPNGPLLALYKEIIRRPYFSDRPVLATSTRRQRLPLEISTSITSIPLGRLDDEHITQILEWYYTWALRVGHQPENHKLSLVAPHLLGHPLAARLAGQLVAEFGPDYLSQYPREIIRLRTDMARALVVEMPLTIMSRRLMEIMAIASTPTPASVVRVAVDPSDDDAFHAAIDQCSAYGLLEFDLGGIAIHPFVAEYFWRSHLHSDGYQDSALALALALRDHLATIGIKDREYIRLLPVCFRAFALANRLPEAMGLRSDLTGELSEAAIFHYYRRDYALAAQYIETVLEHEPSNWQMRLFKARILVRGEHWTDAQELLADMLKERLGDVGVLHTMGWLAMRKRQYTQGLDIMLQVLARRQQHVPALRDAAECLYHLKRFDEALLYIDRAKGLDSDSAVVFSLEARILEEKGDLKGAFDAAILASLRSPQDWESWHRLGRIDERSGNITRAIQHYRHAITVDAQQFTPLASLVSVLLENAFLDEAKDLISRMSGLARNATEEGVVKNLRARILRAEDRIEEAVALLLQGLGRTRSSLSYDCQVLAECYLEMSDRAMMDFPARALESMRLADRYVEMGLSVERNNSALLNLKGRVEARLRP